MDILPPNTLLLFGEFVLKSALILLPGFLLTLYLPKITPSQKHSIWMTLFAIGTAVPAALVFLPRWGILPQFTKQADQNPLPLQKSGLETSSNAPIDSGQISAEIPTAEISSFALADFLLLAWAVGFALLLIRALVGAYLIDQLCKAKAPVPESVAVLYGKLIEHFRKGKEPELILSANVSSPFTFGLLRPKVVLPKEAVDWSDEKLRMILLHEIAHVKRRDSLALILTQLYFSTNWMNPLAWFAVRTATHLREEACDQHVISHGVKSSQYAELLLQQASQPAAPLLRACAPAIADTSTVEKRIKTILTPNHHMKQKADSLKITAALSIFSLAIATAISVAGPNKDPFGGAELKNLTTEEKLKSIAIPNIEFKDTPFQDALDFLQTRSSELDTQSAENRGINIINSAPSANEARITMRLTNVPLVEAIRYTTALAQVSYRVDENAVVIIPDNKDAIKSGEDEDSTAMAAQDAGTVNAAKLRDIKIPALEFVNTPLRDALAFIQQKSMELDKDKNPDTRGINLILDLPDEIGDSRITLRLRNVPLGEVLRYTTSLANSQYIVEENAILVKPN